MNDFQQSLAAKSDQVNNTDLAGVSQTITVTRINVNLKEDQPVSISFAGSEKVYRPCKGMRRVIAEIWGIDPAQYIGRSMTLYRDPDVRFGADTTGGTRISHMSNIDGVKKVTVPVSRGKVKQYQIAPLHVQSAPDPIDTDAAQAAARAAAGQGKAAFTAWWNGDGRPLRDAVKPIMAELTKLASDADGPPPDNTDDAPPM